MSFSDASLKALNDFLEDKSYIEGQLPSKSDAVVFKALGKEPEAKYAHAARWYRHIAAQDQSAFPGEAKELSAFSFTKAEAEAEDDEDIDLFGSDDEVDEEAERLKQQRLAEYHAKKAKKPAVIAKSMITFDVKPWDDETDLKAMEAGVRAIAMDGLVWGTSKLVPVGFGINKLRIACVVEDAKVSTDILEEQIKELEDYVQSVDIEAFSKI
ncbi:elongation factor 1-beta [Syncephalis pseudoplumigaleata]|uniref:Elongation factor 1-beta n=1 Tax=Syncephalis pseudoplumigaleata TaxID=1712513 RepID=A0A4P9Z6M6_9FUNG|nr:elongation factor 1-beta [Syncephalis pseudoplumigaleata]|eukprot:RKP27822.1 elongation factor 1-beta [Syncephalis pseudoplumigaleata]